MDDVPSGPADTAFGSVGDRDRCVAWVVEPLAVGLPATSDDVRPLLETFLGRRSRATVQLADMREHGTLAPIGVGGEREAIPG